MRLSQMHFTIRCRVWSESVEESFLRSRLFTHEVSLHPLEVGFLPDSHHQWFFDTFDTVASIADSAKNVHHMDIQTDRAVTMTSQGSLWLEMYVLVVYDEEADLRPFVRLVNKNLS